MKRILSVFLALTCVLSMLVLLPFAASAAEAGTIGYDPAKVVAVDVSGFRDFKDGYQDGTLTYKITDAAGLVAFSNTINGADTTLAKTLKGLTVYLANDIDMTGIEFVPIGVTGGNGAYDGRSGWGVRKDPTTGFFGGIFDGQGYAIKNWVLDETAANTYGQYALFGTIYGGVVKNLIIDDSCAITNPIGTGAGEHVGFITAGVDYSAQFINISVRGSMSVNATYVGGILGRSIGGANVLFTNCEVLGSITNAAGGAHMGGLVGNTAPRSATAALKFTNCRNAGNHDSIQSYVGGFVGYIQGNASNGVTFTNCINNGTITGKTDGGFRFAGGYVGSVNVANVAVNFVDSKNYGAVNTGAPFVGKVLTAVNLSMTNNGSTTTKNVAANQDCSFGMSETGIDTTYAGAMVKEIGIGIQLTKDTSFDSAKTDLRIISAVDSLDYDQVGFKITFESDNGKGTVEKLVMSKVVYSTILEANGDKATTATPAELLGEYAQYFTTFTLENVPNAEFGAIIYIQSVVEKDGAKYYGEQKAVMIGDHVDQNDVQPLSASVTQSDIVLSRSENVTLTFQNANSNYELTSGTFDATLTMSYNAWPTVVADENGTLYAVASANRLWHVCPFRNQSSI